jgi:hypothetical protein
MFGGETRQKDFDDEESKVREDANPTDQPVL